MELRDFHLSAVTLLLFVCSLFNTVSTKDTTFETRLLHKINIEFIYLEGKSLSELQCAATCARDRRCMSASYDEDDGYCQLSLYRVFGPENQQKLVAESSWTVMSKIGYLEDWIMIGEAYYLLDEELMNFTEAKILCEREGGKLVEPQTSDQNELIRSYLNQHYSNDVFWFWLGLTDIDEEGTFVWESNGVQPLYSGWYPDEPNDESGQEDCVEYNTEYASGEWNDARCSAEAAVICEL